MKKAYILGAGFSKPFGLPLGSELFNNILKFACENKEHDFVKNIIDFGSYSNYLLEVLNLFYPGKAALSNSVITVTDVLFEEFLSEIKTYREMRSASNMDLLASSTLDPKRMLLDFVEKRTLRLLTIYLDSLCINFRNEYKNKDSDIRLLIRKEKNSKHDFITLNYDVLLEIELMKEYGLVNRDNIDPGKPKVIKPHGSIDVWRVSNDRDPNYIDSMNEIENFGIIGKFKYYRDTFYQNRTSTTDAVLAVDNNEYPVIIPPNFFKSYDDPYIKSQVSETVKVLAEADEVILVGCALNPYDKHLRSLIRYAKVIREKSNTLISPDLQKWNVIDPNPWNIAQTIHEEFSIIPTIYPMSWADWVKSAN